MTSAPSEVYQGRIRADFPPGTVVFLIGMRINRLRSLREWLPSFMAMPRMIAELSRHPELGLLHARSFWSGRDIMVVQYWESMEQFMRYATGRDAEHLPAWQAFVKRASSDAGIWHEAYIVDPETSHTVYRDMPAFGMGRATRALPLDQLPPQPVHRHPVSDVLGAVAE